MAHRLKLAIQDALKNTFFANIDDILLRLYYLYEKSPKKSDGGNRLISGRSVWRGVNGSLEGA